MINEIFNLFNLVGSIYCFVTSCFLFMKGFKTKKIILHQYATYFLAVALSLLLVYTYSGISNISISNLQIMTLFAIVFAFIGMIFLLLSTFYIGDFFSKKTGYFQILFSIFCFFLVLVLYPSQILHYLDNRPEISLIFAIIILFCFSIPYIFCIVNLRKTMAGSGSQNVNIEKNLTIFYFLGILISFAKITSFFEINISNSIFNFSFMNIFVLLFFIQGFILVYSFSPLENNQLVPKNLVSILNS